MFVHRDNDDKSDDDQPADIGRPHLTAQNSAKDGASQPTVTDDDDASRDEGKTQMIGDALKSVYQRTLEEDIPDDFLDLLKQLK